MVNLFKFGLSCLSKARSLGALTVVLFISLPKSAGSESTKLRTFKLLDVEKRRNPMPVILAPQIMTGLFVKKLTSLSFFEFNLISHNNY